MSVVRSKPFEFESIRFTKDNFNEVRAFVEFTGHKFTMGTHPFAPSGAGIYYIDQRPGVILTVAPGEWLLYGLSDAKWRVCNDRDYQRMYEAD